MKRTNGETFLAPTFELTTRHMVGKSSDPQARAMSNCNTCSGSPHSSDAPTTNLKGMIARSARPTVR